MRAGMVLCGVFSVALLSVSSAAFLGGTISWMFQPSNDQVRLTYRLSWEKGTGPCGVDCDTSAIGTWGSVQDPSLSSLSWNIKTGNLSENVGDVNYVMTSVSVRNISGWEHGESSFYLNWTRGNQIKICLEDVPWIISGDDRNQRLGYMETTVTSGQRNDTGRMNSSPYASVPAYIGVAYNCSSTIQIPVDDIDGDKLRCRLARMSECGEACTNIPTGSFQINQLACRVTIMAYNDTGLFPDASYRLTLVVEDYPMYEIQMGSKLYNSDDSLSTVPMQLTVRVNDVPCQSGNTLVFVSPTPANNARISFTDLDNSRNLAVDNSFYMQGLGGIHTSKSEVIFSGPAHFNYTYHPDDGKALKRTNVVRVQSVWTPTLPDQIGPQQFCVWGVDTYGITTDPRCITSIVGDDDDHCASGKATCDNNGTCVNVFSEPTERCDCQIGYHSHNCSEGDQCDSNPCYNNGTCIPWSKRFYCICRKGYTGPVCDDVILLCDADPCLNNGTCLDMQDHNNSASFKCLCRSNFTGNRCEDDIRNTVSTVLYTSITSQTQHSNTISTVPSLLSLINTATFWNQTFTTRTSTQLSTTRNSGVMGTTPYTTIPKLTSNFVSNALISSTMQALSFRVSTPRDVQTSKQTTNTKGYHRVSTPRVVQTSKLTTNTRWYPATTTVPTKSTTLSAKQTISTSERISSMPTSGQNGGNKAFASVSVLKQTTLHSQQTTSNVGATNTLINGQETKDALADFKEFIIHISVGLVTTLVILTLAYHLIKRSCKKSKVGPQSEELSKQEDGKHSMSNNNTSSIYNGEPVVW